MIPGKVSVAAALHSRWPEMLQVTRIRPESLVHTLYLDLTVVVRDLIEMPYGVVAF